MHPSISSPLSTPIRKYELARKIQRIHSNTEYRNEKYDKRVIKYNDDNSTTVEGILYIPRDARDARDGMCHLLLGCGQTHTDGLENMVLHTGGEINVTQIGNFADKKEIHLLITDASEYTSSRCQEEIWSPERNSEMYKTLSQVDKLRFYWNCPLEYAAMKAFEFTSATELARETKQMITLIHNCLDVSQYESLFIGEVPPRSITGIRTASRYVNPLPRSGQYCTRVAGPQMMTRWVHNLTQC